MLIDPTWWWHDQATSPFWDELQRAVYEDCLIETSYENYAGDITERLLAPYSLICKSSIWYLLAEQDQEFRTFRVTRFHAVRVLHQSFTRRTDFDLPAYWQEHVQSFESTFGQYRCTLRIHPQYEAFVKWLMPGRWQFVADADEREWITLSLVMESDMLAKMLIFGLAGNVEVISPLELRESVLSQARNVLKHLSH